MKTNIPTPYDPATVARLIRESAPKDYFELVKLTNQLASALSACEEERNRIVVGWEKDLAKLCLAESRIKDLESALRLAVESMSLTGDRQFQNGHAIEVAEIVLAKK